MYYIFMQPADCNHNKWLPLIFAPRPGLVVRGQHRGAALRAELREQDDLRLRTTGVSTN